MLGGYSRDLTSWKSTRKPISKTGMETQCYSNNSKSSWWLLLMAMVLVHMLLARGHLQPLCSLQWRHNERDGVSNHRHHDYLLNRLLRRRSKKTSTLRVTCLCAGNSPVTGDFPAQRASDAENVSIWWRHHVYSMISTNWSHLKSLSWWFLRNHHDNDFRWLELNGHGACLATGHLQVRPPVRRSRRGIRGWWGVCAWEYAFSSVVFTRGCPSYQFNWHHGLWASCTSRRNWWVEGHYAPNKLAPGHELST